MSSVQSKTIPSLSKSDHNRFWGLVRKDANERGCWLWQGRPSSKGYGRFAVGEHVYYVHRISWSLAGRDVPVDLQICHTCDTPLCVNPDHLMMATNAINQRDAKLKRNLAGKHAKVRKPRPDFPLFPHATRRWAKKIRGKLHYFGSTTEDPNGDAALQKWLDQKDDLLAGRIPRLSGDGLTLRDLANRFLTHKRHLADTREITEKTFADYYRTCETLIRVFGKTRLVTDLAAEDFESLRAELATVRGPVGLSNEIGRARVVFKYGADSGLIDRPMRYGQSFKKPSKRVLRQARIAAGPKQFEAKEIAAIVKVASPTIKAMTLLGINGGLGQTDCASLPLSALDLKSGWLDYPRPKTAVQRRIPLWPETTKAIKEAIKARPKQKRDDDAGLLFITKYGERWVRFRRVERDDEKAIEPKEAWVDSVGLEFNKLLKELGIKRRGVGFYTLRRTFETIGGDSKDQVAVDAIMGHSPAANDMAAVYRQNVSDDRLKAVTEHVRKWLFAKAKSDPKPKANSKAKAK